MPRRPSTAGVTTRYPSPYTAVIVVDRATYLVTERSARGFVAVRLTRAEARLAVRTLDDAHADVEARIVGGRRASRR